MLDTIKVKRVKMPNGAIRINVESVHFPDPKEDELTTLFKSFKDYYNEQRTSNTGV